MDTAALHRSACSLLDRERKQDISSLSSVLLAYRAVLTYPVTEAFTDMLLASIPPRCTVSSRILRYVLFGKAPLSSLASIREGKDISAILEDLARIEPVISEAYACFVTDMASAPGVTEMRLNLVPYIDKSFEVLMVEASLLFSRIFTRPSVLQEWIRSDTSHIFS